MAKEVTFGKIDLGLTAGTQSAGASAPNDEPFHIAVLGDFSGRANRGVLQVGSSLAGRRPVTVDRDNFDGVMAKFGVRLDLPIAGAQETTLALNFAELDDFHPDRLFDRLAIFQKLRETRRELNNTATFAAAAERLKGWITPAQGHDAPVPKPAEDEAPTIHMESQVIMDELLASSAARAAQAARSPIDVSALIRDIVEPYVLPGRDPRQPELVAAVDQVISAEMAAVLHHPGFQQIEAAWRALYFLVRRLETEANLKIFVIDVSKSELIADVNAKENLAASGLYKLLVEQTVNTAGGKRCALLIGNYIFDQTADDAQLIGRLARIAKAAAAPFVAGASPHLVGCESFAATPDPDDWMRPFDAEGSHAWSAARKLAEATSVGLALPRFILRLPYGRKADRVERFDFEELATENPATEHYLWGNPAFICAVILGQAYSESGWEFRPEVEQTIDSLPVHTYTSVGEREVKPCAEALLIDRAIERIIDAGLMPLVSLKGRDAVRLYSVHSIAQPQRPLAGRWR
jgi:type VI secretion system protein ImpC